MAMALAGTTSGGMENSTRAFSRVKAAI